MLPNAMRKMKVLVEKFDSLPTVPATLSRVLEIDRDPRSGAKELKEVIIHDPPVSAKVLACANSPYYGFARKTITLSNAVALIGFKAVKNIAIGFSAFACFKDPFSPLSSKINDLYLHCFATALAAESLAIASPVCEPDSAFLNGLLHDIGKMVMITLLDSNYNNIMEIAHDKVANIVDVEKEVLGFDHCDAGAWLLESWKLPPVFVETAQQHHTKSPDQASSVHLISLADNLVRKLGIGNPGDPVVPEISSSILHALSLEDRDLSNVLESMDENRDAIIDMGRP